MIDKEFVKAITTKDVQSFRIKRPLQELLTLEAKRKRKIKNTKEDFDNLKREADKIKIKNEIIIENKDINETIKQILRKTSTN